MKRLSYILPIVFLLSILSPLVFTFNTPDNLAFAQVGCSSPITTPQDNEENGCYLVNAPDRIPYSDLLEIVSDQFFYEDTFVWIEFLIRKGLTIQKRPFGYVPTVVLGGGNGIEAGVLSNQDGSCQYHTFTYQRPALTKDYKVLRNSTEIIMKDGKELNKCKYDLTIGTLNEITIDLIDLGGLGTEEEIQKVIDGGGECSDCKFKVCPDLVEGRDPETGVCPEEETCRVEISQGTKQTYGVKFKKDNCGETGNRIVELDNSGLPIMQAEIESHSQSFIEECNAEREASQPIEELCGNGKIDEGEQCDGGNLNGKSCSNIDTKFTSGELSCTSECKFDTSECRYNIKSELETNIDLGVDPWGAPEEQFPKKVDGKVVVTLELIEVSDNSLPREVEYFLTVDAPKKAWEGIYGVSMLTLYDDARPVYDKLTKDMKQAGGFFSEGIILRLNKEDSLTIEEIISRDTKLYDALNRETEEDDRVKGEIIINIKYLEGGNNADIRTSQIIASDRDLGIASSQATQRITKAEADQLTWILIKRFGSYEEFLNPDGSINKNKAKTSLKEEILVPDKEKIRESISTLKKGEKVSIKWTLITGNIFMQKKDVEFIKIEIKDILEYLKKIFPQFDSSSQSNSDLDEEYAFIGVTITGLS